MRSVLRIWNSIALNGPSPGDQSARILKFRPLFTNRCVCMPRNSYEIQGIPRNSEEFHRLNSGPCSSDRELGPQASSQLVVLGPTKGLPWEIGPVTAQQGGHRN